MSQNQSAFDQSPSEETHFADQRRRMVQNQIRARGITHPGVLEAMEKVPREQFVPEPMRGEAFSDRALPIDANQTISQPFMVASMTAYLDIHATDRVLEIGTGSGYQAAVLAQLAEMVYTVERIPELSDQAQQRLNALGIDNVRYKTDDGTLGWQEESPFDRILVTAAAPQLPHDLANQLTADGRMVIPIGDANQQTLTIVEKRKGRLVEMPQYSCRFVKLIGHQGWPDDKR